MSMGKHSRTARPRLRSALAAGLVGLGAMGAGGTAQAQEAAPVEGTPCTDAASACVDLAGHQAWLIDDGEIVRGPVPISSGGPGRETPTGDFRVEWKNANHRSTEFDGAPMPFAVFFAEGGIAFHEGNLDTPSAGCVRLAYEDAAAFYDFLQTDDGVQVR
jgi:lipoprotein-anchoring transpeptidase ErfK/SrfK